MPSASRRSRGARPTPRSSTPTAPPGTAVAANLATTGLAARADVVGDDVEAHLRRLVAADGPPVDLVLLDPPYATADDTWERLLALVGSAAPGAVVVVESDREVPLPEGWDALRVKRYGGTLVSVLMPPSPPPEPS